MINVFTVCAHMVDDPKRRESNEGKVFVKGRFAWNTGYGDRKNASFANFIVFGASGEKFEELMHRGDAVFLSGELEMEKWEDKEGRKRETPLLRVRQWWRGPESRTRPEAAAAEDRMADGPGVADNDIPF